MTVAWGENTILGFQGPPGPAGPAGPDGAVGSVAAINASEAPYNLTPGTTVDQHAAMQAALDQARANYLAGSGPTKVTCGPGTFWFDLHRVPGVSSTVMGAMFWTHPGIELELPMGTTIKLKAMQVLPEDADFGAGICCSYPYDRTIPYGGIQDLKDRWAITGHGTLDLNGANQRTDLVDPAGMFHGACWHGVHVNITRSPVISGLRIINLWGTGSGPPNESYALSVFNSPNGLVSFCEFDGSGIADSATGLNEGWNHNLRVVSCSSHDHSHGFGYVTYKSSGTSYVGCIAYNCPAVAGFSDERGERTTYTNCHAGGKGYTDTNVFIQVPGGGSGVRQPCRYGWWFRGTAHARVDSSCTSLYCLDAGVRLDADWVSTPEWVANDIVIEGSHRHVQNTLTGFEDSGGLAADQRANIFIDPLCYSQATGVGTFTAGSKVITNYSGSVPHPGQFIQRNTVSPNVPEGTIVVAVSGTTVTMSEEALATDVGVQTFCWATVVVNAHVNNEPGAANTVQGYKPFTETFDISGTDGKQELVSGSSSWIYRLMRGSKYNTVYDLAVTGAGRLIAHLPNALTTGEETFPREISGNGAGSMTSGLLRVAMFTARKTNVVTQIRVVSGNQAAGATPTLVRIGVFKEEANGDLTLIASTPNDTTLLAATFTPYTKALSVPFTKTVGVRYGVGLLVVTAAALPQIYYAGVIGADMANGPRLVGNGAGLVDLPATLTVAAMTAAGLSGVALYAVLLP